MQTNRRNPANGDSMDKETEKSKLVHREYQAIKIFECMVGIEKLENEKNQLKKDNTSLKKRLDYIERYLFDQSSEYKLSTLPKPTKYDHRVDEIISDMSKKNISNLDISPLIAQYESQHDHILSKTLFKFIVEQTRYTIHEREGNYWDIETDNYELIISLIPCRSDILRICSMDSEIKRINSPSQSNNFHHNTLKKTTDYLKMRGAIWQIGTRGGKDPRIRFLTLEIFPNLLTKMLHLRILDYYYYRGLKPKDIWQSPGITLDKARLKMERWGTPVNNTRGLIKRLGGTDKHMKQAFIKTSSRDVVEYSLADYEFIYPLPND